MASTPPSPTNGLRRRVLVGMAIGWVLIVVAGAGASADDSLLGVDDLHIVWIVFLGLAVALSIVFLIFLNPFGGEWVPPERKRRSIGFWVLCAIALALYTWQPDIFSGLGDEEEDAEVVETFEVELDSALDEPAADVVAQAADLLLILAGVVLLAGVWLAIRYRSRQEQEVDPDEVDHALETDLASALAQASHELAITGDPRTAVLRSYAILETTLAQHGSSRTVAETPSEHLRRSLRNLRVDATPIIELGTLYELARFSEHEISASQQSNAATALEQARASLAALV